MLEILLSVCIHVVQIQERVDRLMLFERDSMQSDYIVIQVIIREASSESIISQGSHHGHQVSFYFSVGLRHQRKKWNIKRTRRWKGVHSTPPSQPEVRSGTRSECSLTSSRNLKYLRTGLPDEGVSPSRSTSTQMDPASTMGQRTRNAEVASTLVRTATATLHTASMEPHSQTRSRDQWQ